MKRFVEIYKQCEQDTPGVTFVTLAVIAYTALIVWIVAVAYNPFMYIFTILIFFSWMEVINEWRKGYLHWKSHHEQ